MSKPITSFFVKQPATKRGADEEGPSSAPKASKTGSEPDLFEENRMKALAKLAAKNGAAVVSAVAPIASVAGDATGMSLEQRTMHASWYSRLQPEFSKPYFTDLAKFLETERASKVTIFPPEDEVYSWSNLCPFDTVRVVILGQDPYINVRQAHGLAFSVNEGVPPPPSLVNMYKELANDIPGFKITKNGSLVSWAQQGVLLLNASLTVRSANSHAGKGWEKLTDAVIKLVNDSRKDVVFLLWGNYAKQKGKSIDAKRHCVIQCAHPSPLSAHNGFFGSKCFSRANEHLVKTGQVPIDWSSVSP